MKCRGCRSKIPENILIKYSNMPKSAQFFPLKEEIDLEKGVDIVLLQCPYCGLVQTSGTPVPYYRDVIRAIGVSEEMKKFRKKQFESWVKKYNLGGKSVIEIGCGRGEYMQLMEMTGVKVAGLEHLNDSVQQGNKEGHCIFKGFVENEEYSIPEAPYNAFYTMNFLEHIPEPGTFLCGIAANLTPEAVGIVEVPNLDMILEKSLYSEFIQDHLTYFTKNTLCHILEQNGFEVIQCENIWYGYILSAEVKKRTLISTEGFKDKQKKIKNQIDKYLEEKKQEGKKVAVWGAGHQALANLSQLNMTGSIEYVIDSAVFKQNKYTPATHIPVVSPKTLKNGMVQAVIIMAASYSEEIKRIMEEEYPEIEAVILHEEGIYRRKNDKF